MVAYTSCEKEPDADRSQVQAIVYPNLGIGEGFDTRYSDKPDYQGTGGSCVIDENVSFTEEPRYATRMSSFYSIDKLTLENEIKADLNVDLGFGDKDSKLSVGVNNTFKYTKDLEQEGVVITFAATITTRTRGFDSLSELSVDGFNCDDNGALGVDDFLDICGTKYLAREDLGGVILFAFNLNSLTSEEKTFFQNSTDIGVAGSTVDLGGTVDLLRTVLSDQREVFVWTYGFATPPVKVSGDVTTLEDLHNFVQNLGPESGTAVMKQYFENYNPLQFNDCGVDPAVQDQLACSIDLYANQERLRDNIRFRRTFDWLVHAANNPSEYRYIGATPEEVVEFVRDTEICVNEYEQSASKCDETINDGDFEQLCEACQIPQVDDFKCDFRSLNARADALLADIKPAFVPADTFDPANTAENLCEGQPCVVQDITVGQGGGTTVPRDKYLCTFSGMMGHFAGNGESVRIKPTISGNTLEWNLSVNSLRTEADEKLKGYFHCSHKDAFFYSSGSAIMQDPLFTTINADHSGSPPGSIGQFRTGLSGVKGKMEGLGEKVGFDRPNTADANKVFAYSGQGDLEGYFTSFGPLNSNGSQAELELFDGETTFSYTTTGVYGHHREQKLPHMDEAHCYVTRIAGDFDGHAEAVKLWIGEDLHWRLTVRASDKPKEVRGVAKCIAYNQTP